MVTDPDFIIFVGPMFGSKTTRLLAAIDRYRYQKKNVVAFKPRMDDRYSSTEISTHSGGKIFAIGSQTHKLSSDTAIVDWANLSWQTATITARGALIYNDSQADKAVCVLDFGGDKTATAGTFTIQFPNFTDTLAILRIA